ncbi:MAG: hypothetical protein WBM04_00195, partial [Candidatus Korobacteraceae bacterium]
FESRESFNRAWPQSLYYSTSIGFSFLGSVKPFEEVGNVLTNREIQIIERPFSSSGDVGQVITKVVERAPQVMNSIPNNDLDFVGNGIGVCEIPDAIPEALLSIQFILKSNEICFRPKSLPRNFKFTDIAFGPFDL